MHLLALISVLSLLAAAEDPFDQSLQALVNEPWFPSPDEFAVEITNVSPQCQNDTQRWIGSLESIVKDVLFCALSPKLCTDKRKKELKQNIYGIKQLDAFGRAPSGILMGKYASDGSPDECTQVSKNYIYKTKYCFVKSNIAQSCSHPANDSLYWTTSVCMPASCSDNDIVEVLSQLNMTTMGGLLDHCSATCVKDKPETDTFTWVFTGVMAGIVLLCLLGSAVEYILQHVLGNPVDLVRNPGIEAIVAFSLFSNASQILDTRPGYGRIRSLDCIRFFSMLWVVSGHIFMFYGMNDELLPLLQIPKQILSDTLLNAFFSVDTFFVLSGLLVSYMFFKMLQKNPGMMPLHPFTWIMFYVHRYLRLTPPYMLFICFYIAVVPLFTGVLSSLFSFQSTVDVCRRLWWQNLIYINNFDINNSCYDITWYLAADTQMYVAAPILLIAFFISYKLGLIGGILIITGSTVACITLMVTRNFPATVVFDLDGSFMQDIYVMPWMRCPPYVIGICTGYFLAKYGHKKQRVNKINILVSWGLAIAVALACIYGPYGYLNLERTYWNKGVRTIYYSFSRIGWGLFICWVVVANHYDWAGPISSFMCHPLWQPLGRLSYTAYIVHMFVIFYFFNLFDTPPHYTSPGEQFITCTIPVTVMAYIFAFFWSCLCELPFLKLEKLMVDTLTRTGKKRLVLKSREPEEVKEKKGKIENWDDDGPKVQEDDTRM